MTRLMKRSALASCFAVVAVLTVGGSTASAASIPGCVPATNIEGIIDDSGSMLSNDPNHYRADLLEALAFFNQDKTMGAAIFADEGVPLFGPFPVGPNLPTITGALASVSSSGAAGFGTDYTKGFTAANAQNPAANARVFLSDGEPNDTPDPNLWRAPNILSYVVGFGSADFTILNQIAADTGGPAPFTVTTASQLRNVSQIINARINCEPDPVLIEKPFVRQGQTQGIGFKADGSTAQVLISWPTIGNVFKPSFTTGGKGAKKGVASAAKKKKKSAPKVQSQRGESFLALNFSKIKGKVSFKLSAKTLLLGETVTIAIIK